MSVGVTTDADSFARFKVYSLLSDTRLCSSLIDLWLHYDEPRYVVFHSLFDSLLTPVEAMQFTADLKLGHYMKIPPRPMFWCQASDTFL